MNLPSKYEESFIAKIKRFFIKTFRPQNKIINDSEIVESLEDVKEKKDKNDIFDKMKLSSKKVNIKADIFNIIRANPELLKKMNLEQLQEINKMYDEKIKEKERSIKRLKR